MQALDPNGIQLLRQVVEWMVAGDFKAVAVASGNTRLSAEEMREAIESYGRTLVHLPDSVWEDLDVIRVEVAVDPTWAVCVDLWTLEEGRSDLSLECTITTRGGAGGATIEIDDIRVL